MDQIFKKFFELSHDLLVIGTREGRFIAFSPSWTKVLGWSEQELMSLSATEMIHPDDIPATLEQVNKMLNNGHTISSFSNRYRHKDGSWRHLLWTGIYNSDDDLIYAIAKDNTDSEKLMAQLVAGQKMESIGRLAGGIAHDFNNLLVILYGNLEALARHVPNDEKAQQYMKNLESTSRRAADLTKQLLAFSRRQVLTPTVQSLNSLVHEAEKLLNRLLGKHIEIKLKLSDELGLIEADSGQIIQIFLNLALNARDAMPNGGTLTLETTQFVIESDTPQPDLKPGAYAKLTVTDTGHGIEKDILEKIFDPFFTTKKPGKGTGLGLSTVYGIIKQSGGYISVESEIDKGTTFHILLPITSKTLPVFTPKSIDQLDFAKSNGKCILLVEDESGLRALIKEALEGEGFKVLTAECGKSGLQMIQTYSEAIDLLLTDLRLPGSSGLDLVNAFYNSHPERRSICISGYPIEELQAKLKKMNSIFISKPFKIAQLADSIRKQFI